MNGKLEGKVALVTGGARGIGAAIVRRLHADGASVAITDVLDDAGRALASDVFKLLGHPCAGKPFDLALADPPYAEAKANGWQARLADLLAQNGWVKPGGVFVFETEGHDPLPALTGWRLARDKTYGSTRVLIWVRQGDIN